MKISNGKLNTKGNFCKIIDMVKEFNILTKTDMKEVFLMVVGMV
jgi:hypothetical protein